MAVREITLAAIRRFGRQATPAALNREVVLQMTVRGDVVTIWERRPPTDKALEEWTRMQVTQMRYNPAEAPGRCIGAIGADGSRTTSGACP